jgi:hypothetical protein
MHQIFSMTIFSIDYRKDRAETDSCTVISPWSLWTGKKIDRGVCRTRRWRLPQSVACHLLRCTNGSIITTRDQFLHFFPARRDHIDASTHGRRWRAERESINHWPRHR